MKAKVGVSKTHIHLTEEVYNRLFDEPLEKRNDLVQPNQFASTKVLTLKHDNYVLENIRVMGPFREYNQVEVTKTDSYKLHVNPPIRTSGDLNNSLPITLVNGEKEVYIENGLIIANRHIHISKLDANELGIEDNKVVSLKVNGYKPGILKNVYFKVLDNANLEIHLDSDDANACLINQGDEVEIIDEV